MDDNTAAVAVLVPIFGTFFVFGLPIIAFIFFRVLAHRERMEMIRHGIAPPVRGPRSALGPASPGSGTSSWCGRDGGRGLAPDVALNKGIRLAFIGFALTIGLSFIDHHHLGPWLLGGLIPLFIGLSQVVIALLSGASLGVPRADAGAAGVPPPVYGEPVPPERPTYEGSYTYRPGSAQELRPPTSPPERRS